MPKRKRDTGKTYQKIAVKKRKAKLAKENMAQKLRGSMENFVFKKPVDEQDASDCFHNFSCKVCKLK